jgi:hypothetical protein
MQGAEGQQVHSAAEVLVQRRDQLRNNRAAGQVGARLCRGLSASRSTVPLKCWSSGATSCVTTGQQDRLVQGRAGG